MHRQSVITLILAALCLCGCNDPLRSPEIKGIVLDADSKQPIPNAVVLGQWRGHRPAGLVEGHTVCYHVESAVSDEFGRYVLPAWKNSRPTAEETRLRFEDLGIVAYKRGFVWVPSAREEEGAGTIYARRFIGTEDERIWNMRVGSACGIEDGSNKNRLPFLRELLFAAIAFREETGNDGPAMAIRGEIQLLGGNPAEVDTGAPGRSTP